jgi:hypothetical protein
VTALAADLPLFARMLFLSQVDHPDFQPLVEQHLPGPTRFGPFCDTPNARGNK